MNQKDAFRYKISNSDKEWRLDEDGFLRCTTTVLKSTVMDYAPFEFSEGQLPQNLQDKAVIKLYVPAEELANADSLATLEGKPIGLDHEWQIGGSIESVGNVAGKPRFDSATNFLFADILINDPATIRRITQSTGDERLIDQSAAYHSTIDWTAGITPDGQSYDGVQRDLRYNHIALLPQGAGRAGEDVRILNRNGSESKVSEFTYVKIGNSRIRVYNEDVEKLENEVEKQEEEVKNKEVKNADEADEKVKNLSAELANAKKENDSLKGQVEQLKNSLEEVTNAETIRNSVEEAIKEHADAEEVMNAYPEKDNDEKVKNAKKLYGHELRSYVVNHVRIANGKEALTQEELKNEDKVRGMFQILKDTVGTVKGSKKSTISGHGAFKAMNEKADEGKYDSATARKALKFKLYNESKK